MTRPLVALNGVSKVYPSTHRSHSRLKGWWSALTGTRQSGNAVLSDIDLQIFPGESVAIVGENGAGKSTLLKLVAGVLNASTGDIQRAGTMGALLELGAGFHPDYSGRRNALLACGLMGVVPEEAEANLTEIIEFSGLAEKIDEPVKHYSSGMIVRLGFAVMAQSRPDLLVSDEVLAVGDVAFQRKCIAWLERYLADGGTLLLVSHSVYHAQKLCQRACWLHRGAIELSGDVFEVAQAYLAHHERKIQRRLTPNQDRIVCSDLALEGVCADQLTANQQLVFCCHLNEMSSVRLQLCRTDGAIIAALVLDLHAGRNRMDCQLPDLLPGQYLLEVVPLDAQSKLNGVASRLSVRVVGQSREFGSLRLARAWGR